MVGSARGRRDCRRPCRFRVDVSAVLDLMDQELQFRGIRPGSELGV